MKKILLIIFTFLSVQGYAQKVEKDLKYYYYYVNQDDKFMAYLKAKKTFNQKKFDFKLPATKKALQEMEVDKDKILRNERTYTEFLTKYGMKNAGEYAKLYFNQMHTLKTFLKKNPEFYNLSAKERQNIIDKWYYSDIAAN